MNSSWHASKEDSEEGRIFNGGAVNDLRFLRWARSGRSGTAAEVLEVYVGVVVGKDGVYPKLLSKGST